MAQQDFGVPAMVNRVRSGLVGDGHLDVAAASNGGEVCRLEAEGAVGVRRIVLLR